MEQREECKSLWLGLFKTLRFVEKQKISVICDSGIVCDPVFCDCVKLKVDKKQWSGTDTSYPALHTKWERDTYS